MLKDKSWFAKVEREKIEVVDRARREFGDLEELKKSITEVGLLHPVVLVETEAGLQLLAGERRLRALTELGWDHIPATVYPPLDLFDRKTIEAHENMKRKGLAYAEECFLIEEIHRLQLEKYGQRERSSAEGYSLQDTADLIGISKTAVASSIKLARMIKEVPGLGELKNMAEAVKTMQRAEVDVKRAESAQAYQEVVEEQGEDRTRRNLIDSYIVKDLMEGLSLIERETVDLVEFDPPYGIELDKLKKTGAENMDGYTELTQAQFRQEFPKWISAIYRTMAPDSWMLCWFSIKYHFEFVASTMESVGLKVNRKPCIWIRPTGQSMAPEYNLASAYDTFFAARKGRSKLAEPGRIDVYGTAPIMDSLKVHPTERPIELYEEILQTFASPNCLIGCPCLGSGNILLAAANMQMRAFGFELNQSNKDAYVGKVMDGYPGTYRSLLI